jgi:UDP-N-acetylglucosamine 2-epimerase
VIDTGYDADEIETAIRCGLYDETFRSTCRSAENPYGKGGAGRKIADVLAQVDLSPRLLRKEMTLRGETNNGWFR